MAGALTPRQPVRTAAADLLVLENQLRSAVSTLADIRCGVGDLRGLVQHLADITHELAALCPGRPR